VVTDSIVAREGRVGKLEAAITPIPEFAYYYGDWFWNRKLVEWMKCLLLFFDGIAFSLPSDVASYFIDADPI
jgi:hypothetical protein